MTKEITPKERERILTKGALILFIFFIAAFLLTFFIPVENRLLPFSAIVLFGMFCSGVYASRKFARNYEEFVWGITVFLIVCIFFSILFYQLYLVGIGITQPVLNLILNIFLLWLPISMITGCFVFEILSSRKIKKPFSFHVKRFTGRMVLTEICFLLIAAVSYAVNLLAPFLPERFLITAFIFAFLILSAALYLMTKNPKVGRFFSKLEKGEW
jgi:hypothetical protein